MSEDQKLNFIDFLMKSLDDYKAEMERLRLSFEEDKRKSEEAFEKLLEELKKVRKELSKKDAINKN